MSIYVEYDRISKLVRRFKCVRDNTNKIPCSGACWDRGSSEFFWITLARASMRFEIGEMIYYYPSVPYSKFYAPLPYTPYISFASAFFCLAPLSNICLTSSPHLCSYFMRLFLLNAIYVPSGIYYHHLSNSHTWDCNFLLFESSFILFSLWYHYHLVAGLEKNLGFL